MLCLAIDIAKGKSVVGLFDETLKAIIPLHEIAHEQLVLEKLVLHLDPSNVEIILESTSMYHYPVVSFFEKRDFHVIILNPIISKEHKRNLRKTKTDRTDCENLASIYFEKKFNIQRKHLPIYLQMQSISRHIFTLNESMVRYKNRYHQLLELIFPTYEYQVKNESKFKSERLALLRDYPHPELILKTRVDKLASVLAGHCKTIDKRYLKTAQKIKDLAHTTLSTVSKDDVIVDQFAELSSLIIDLQLKIKFHQQHLINLAQSLKLYHHIFSIPGISSYMAALLVAELKDITLYKTVKQLIAACGLDPTIIQSGKSVDYRGHISKRGNKHARKALFNAVTNIIRTTSRLNPNDDILLYYRKKRSENKHHYASVIACTTKLLRIIFTL
ncbi:MAG: IS110 family transposase, partial [Acholeplasmataceae bacterium]|nr:IS110 family transposase [Acholeplasmataceae bacterium]